MRIVAKTDVGLVRKRNEDFFIIADSKNLVVLCDGMGGHPGGDLASRMVAEEVEHKVTASNPELPELLAQESVASALEPFRALLHGIFEADLKLRDYGSKNPEFHGLGTTVVAMQENEGSICVLHVGDSRVYSFKQGKLEQVTHDHSVVATHPEYAHLAGMRNILTRAMGVGEQLEVDFSVVAADTNVGFLLCTDGLHNYVPEQRIAEILRSDETPEKQAEALIEEAKQGGGGDNITLSLAWPTKSASRKSPRLRGVVVHTAKGFQVQLDEAG
jgi:protein phosphatase